MLVHILKNTQYAVPLLWNHIYLVYLSHSATFDDVIRHIVSVLQFFLRLFLHPCGTAVVTFSLQIERHG